MFLTSALKMESECFFETWASTCETTGHRNPRQHPNRNEKFDALNGDITGKINLKFQFTLRQVNCFKDVRTSRQTMRWSLRGVNILSAVRGEYNACRWTEDFLLVSAKVT
jgi:hypothetical protein